MRLDNDHSKSSQSPSRNFANGSSQASGPRSPLAKGTNGSTHSRTSVLNGDWEEAEELLFGSSTFDSGGGVGLDPPYGKPWGKSRSRPNSQRSAGLTLAEGANREVMLFCLKQQKYLELLERRDLSKALAVLRQELTPLHQDVGRLHALSA